jgi:ATP-dependent DNA helicase RecG
METTELLEIIARDEDGQHQFKAQINNQDQLASELIAFCNSGGGQIFVGVNNDGTITGLTREDVSSTNKILSTVATDKVRPAINVKTQNIELPNGLVMVITIADGMSKPYMTKGGVIWVKNGADKRKATSREEMQRMYQSASLIHGDEIPINGMTISDLDHDYFSKFFEKEYGEKLEEQEVGLAQLLENMNLMKNRDFNISGALLFAKKPQFKLPVFLIKAVCYPGIDIHADAYLESRDIDGKLADIFQKTLGFILGNLKRPQGEQNVNSEGEYEIPRIALEEILANALIHRDYFVSAPIRVFMFDNRVEIISPGHLPNNLTIENIKKGNSNIRNPILVSFATKILPYRGLGNGVRRALKHYAEITFESDRDGNQFIVTFQRKLATN